MPGTLTTNYPTGLAPFTGAIMQAHQGPALFSHEFEHFIGFAYQVRLKNGHLIPGRWRTHFPVEDSIHVMAEGGGGGNINNRIVSSQWCYGVCRYLKKINGGK